MYDFYTVQRNSTLKAEPLRCRARFIYSSSDSSGAQYGIMDLNGIVGGGSECTALSPTSMIFIPYKETVCAIAF